MTENRSRGIWDSKCRHLVGTQRTLDELLHLGERDVYQQIIRCALEDVFPRASVVPA